MRALKIIFWSVAILLWAIPECVFCVVTDKITLFGRYMVEKWSSAFNGY